MKGPQSGSGLKELINIWNTVILKDAVEMKSDIF